MKKSKKISIFCFVVILIVSLLALIVHAENTFENSNDDFDATIYFSIETNKDLDSISIPENLEGDPSIPDSFLVSNQFIFIDDAYNSRILVYENKKYINAIKLEWNFDVKKMYYDDDLGILKLIFLDLNVNEKSNYKLVSYDVKTGQIIEKINELSKENYELLNFFFDGNGNIQTDYLKFVNDKPDDTTRNRDFLIDKTILDRYCLGLKGIDSKYIIESYYETIGIDGDMRIINYGIMADNLKSGYCFSNFLIKISSDDELEYVETITDKHRRTIGCISYDPQNGDYYQMVISDSDLLIYQLRKNEITSLSDRIQQSIMDGQDSALDLIIPDKSIRTTYYTQDPEDVRDMMDTYLNYSWTYDSDENGDITVVPEALRGYVTKPTWLSAISDGSPHNVTSIPYCWGGWNAQTFSSHLAEGDYAGNIESTVEYGQITNTIGMDCSGYVSVAYDLPSKHGTTTLYLCFTNVNKYEVRPYYILNKSDSHVRIVSNAYYSAGGYYVDFYEESSSAGKARVLTAQNYATIYSGGYIPAIYDEMPYDPRGNTIATAYTVTSPLYMSDYISYSQDTDMYRFIPSTTQEYTIETTGSTDTLGIILNSTGTAILGYDDDSGSGTNFKIERILTQGETYYIMVRGYSQYTEGLFYLNID